jgi:hypothetical protein
MVRSKPGFGGVMSERVDEFQGSRAELNEEILGCEHLGRKRSFVLGPSSIRAGAAGHQNKGVAGAGGLDGAPSPGPGRGSGLETDEVIDALNVALVVGGSITILHVRRAFATMREIPGRQHEVK